MDSQLGPAVRAWRERLNPMDLGLPAGVRRRAPGLRREELAGLTGISVDYLTRLEQGRATTPSDQVVSALARALRLADRERELLFRLAGLAVPERGHVPRHLAPSIQRLLDRFAAAPVIVYDATWTLVTANAPFDALMGDTSAWSGWERNAVWRSFTGAPSRARLNDAERDEQHRQLVSDLRLTAARYPHDPRLNALVDELSAVARFAELWRSGDLGDAEAPARHKIIDHPEVGPIELDCDTLVVAGDDLRVMIHSAEPGTSAAASLDLAVALGVR